ncbi:MAG: hypothetical protein ACOCVM_08315 [Desulfovibrionaceae bacterium]
MIAMAALIVVVLVVLMLYRLHEKNKEHLGRIRMDTLQEKNFYENKMVEYKHSTQELEQEVELLKHEIVKLESQVDVPVESASTREGS